MLQKTAAAPKAANPPKLHPFLPKEWGRGPFLLWLKRTHAWSGLFGALMFLLLGVSGILLNHRSVMKIETGAPTVSKVELVREGAPFANEEAFAAWVQETYGVVQEAGASRAAPAVESVSFEGTSAIPAERWDIRFRGPNAALEASYLPEANLVVLERTAYSFATVLKELHMGHGIGLVWILLIDAVGGALIVMSLSGILLWSRLHGPRLAALGLLGGALAWSLLGAWPQMIASVS
jgi:hypothetical protein